MIHANILMVRIVQIPERMMRCSSSIIIRRHILEQKAIHYFAKEIGQKKFILFLTEAHLPINVLVEAQFN